MDSIFSVRTFIVSGTLLVGSAGAAYIIYRQHVMCRQQRNLKNQIRDLNQHIEKLQREIRLMKEAVVTSSSTDEGEDIFVDASDIVQKSSHEDTNHVTITEETYETVETGGETTEETIRRVDQLMEQGGYENLQNAYVILTNEAQQNPNNTNIQWRLSKAAFLLASEELIKDPDCQDKQKNLMQKAQAAASKALEINKEDGNAHKWMAIIIGSITQFLPIQEQIRSAYTIKEHIEAAIRYKPGDSLAYHMLGRWCFSVYSLSWVERKVASTLFAEPPTASLEDALNNFLKAEELYPKGSIDNALYLAKVYIAQRDYARAVKWLKVGQDLPRSTRDDEKSHAEIKDLLTQYASYDYS